MEEPFPLLPITSSDTIRKCAALPLRPTDVFVTSYPKSGTTWMQHIVHTLATNGESPLPHISDACPFFEVDRTWATDSDELAEGVQQNHAKINRRIFNTHLRWRMMPKSHPDARYVYLVRNAVDACVSFYHHLSHQAEEDGGYTGAMGEFIAEWTEGKIAFGSWSAHLKSWLGRGGAGTEEGGDSGTAAAADDPRVLIVPYEGLKADPKRWVGRVNEHCRFGLSEARLDELLPRFSFEWMRANEAMFEPRSVRWVKSKEEEAAAAAKPEGEEAAGGAEGGGGAGGADAAAAAFHFIRAGRVGDGVEAFGGPAQLALLREMVAKTFPPETTATVPEYVAARLPSGCLGP